MGLVQSFSRTGIFAAVLLAIAPPLLAGGGETASERDAVTHDVLVHWRGQRFRADAPPPQLAESTRVVIDRWAVWAGEADYAIHVDAAERVLLFTAKATSPARRDAKLVEKTLAFFDELLPRDAGAHATHGARRAAAGEGRTTTAEEPIVLFDLRDERDYGVVLDRLAERHLYLTSWIVSAKGTTGFTLEEPLCGAWLEEADDLEEWDPANELVNRLARLLLHEHFGTVPYWVTQGVAWYAESELTRGIYSFPYRTGFVGVTEHDDWDKELKRAFRPRKDDPLRLEELASWRRGTFNEARAHMAWGVVAYFAKHQPEDLAPILTSLAEFHEVHSKQSFDDGTWQRIAGYAIPAEDQMEIFQEHAGHDFLAQVTEFFRKGSKYRAPRRRRS